jgi:putative sugar O-methyltransferase
MKLRLKHLRHPFQAANAAKALVAGRWNMRRLVDRGQRHFASDARYDLKSVTEGFAARVDGRDSDAALLERICTSYIKAAKEQQSAPEIYRATDWWEQQRKSSLKPVIQALMTHDIAAVGGMYRNFYRDPCSAGLIALQSILKNYFGETIKDFHRRLYLVDTLYHIDHWKALTGGCFTLSDLSGPPIGNPFGVVIEGTLIRAGAEYQHYCAHRISGLLDSGTATVVEVGGGFGGMAYYLLRDRPGTTYVDFDVPESIALTSYYLLKAFPQLRFLLYGEGELTEETISRADVVLMPAFELAKMPRACADVAFSSHAMSDLSHEAMVDYLNNIADMTRSYFIYIGNGPSGKAISDLVDQRYHSMKLAKTLSSGWHDHKIRGISEVECLYRICGT